ncbi:MAG: hypothetical protein IKO36_03735 [Bacteroidaceae bacterium]|nr:hypothetical protein [Bacteroidaceae bacterium]
MTKEEYIADRLRVVQRELSREIAYTDRQLTDISIKKEKLEQFNRSINNL